MNIRAAILGYIDAFWVSAATVEVCQQAYDSILSLLTSLGFKVNEKKCVPPTRRLIFLGFELDSWAEGGVCQMTIPTDKKNRGVTLCSQFLAHVPPAGGRCIGYSSSLYESLVGFLAHCASVTFGGRLYLTHLYRAWRFARQFAFTPDRA